ncbi:MAG: tRNA (adenosine(37)-N6)-threonylcarbamoyltransferase complex ATPase subunit type 1 TsaE [Thermodesulfobacteriota bacterium]
MKSLRKISRSPEETRTLAARLAKDLAPGDVVALKGELGSGKTEFVRGLAQGLAVAPETPVASPSFVLVHEYPGRCPLVHLDLYRLETVPPEFLPELEEYLFGPQVTAIEWAERLNNLLPENHLEIKLTITGEAQREITLIPHGPRGNRLLEAMVE